MALVMSHLAMHCAWYECVHGRRHSFSPCAYASWQMTHEGSSALDDGGEAFAAVASLAGGALWCGNIGKAAISVTDRPRDRRPVAKLAPAIA